jgi:hypothetical protein
MNNLLTTLDTYLAKKAPALPLNIKEILVKFAPWLTILGVILSIPAILGFFGLGALMMSTPYGAYGLANSGLTYTLAIIFLGVTTVMRGIAIPGLLAKTKSGWMMLFYSTLVNLVYSILSFDIIGGLLGALISLYLLFQVREFYK